MVPAQDFMSAETLSLLRDNFSPCFRVNDATLRPTVDVFNKLKSTLSEETYRQVVGLLLQYNQPQTAENLYHRILVENRLLHLLRQNEDLRFELLDVLHATTDQPMAELMNDEGESVGDSHKDNANYMTCPSSYAHEKPGKLKEENDIKQLSREFGLSRQLYEKIPTSLHHSNVDDLSSTSDDEMRDVTLHTDQKQKVLIDEHLHVPTEQLGVCSNTEERCTNGTKMATDRRGSSKRKARNGDQSGGEGGGEIIESQGESGVVDKLCLGEECVENECTVDIGGRGRKRARRVRQGAREDDMMLRKVGSHCIVIGVKEHAITTDSSDCNTQSETETMESEPMASQDDDKEEGALVIVEEKQSSTKPKRQKKRSRSGKSSANLVKVSALCRGASMSEKFKTRSSTTGKRLKERELQVVLKKGLRLPRSPQNINNSCSTSELSDDDVLNTYMETASCTESLALRKTTFSTSDDEKTVLDILSSVDSEGCRSETQTSTLSSRLDRKRLYPDNSMSIKPFTSYLGLQPRSPNEEISFPKQDKDRLLKSDRLKSVHSSNKSRPKALAALRNHSKSARPKYDPNFPFSTVTFAAMSSIAEATSFEGCDFLDRQPESSQEDAPDFTDWDTASSQESYMEHDRAYGLGTFAQDDADDISFLNRLLRSPSPPSFGGTDGIMAKKRRRHHKPKKERKPRKPRRSRRIRGKRSRESDVDTSDNITSNTSKAVTGRACTCCL